VAVHIIAITLMALPAPGGGMNRANWKNQTVQMELKEWTERLNRWGVALTTTQLEDKLWTLSSSGMRIRRSLLKPFRPYYRNCGTGQSWRMFVAPHRHPARLSIDLFEEESWRTIYTPHDPQHAWLAGVIEFDRFRSLVFRYGWGETDRHYRRDYDQFTHWLARRARQDFPEATKLRVRFYKYRTRSPQELRADTPEKGKFILVRTLPLKDEPS